MTFDALLQIHDPVSRIEREDRVLVLQLPRRDQAPGKTARVFRTLAALVFLHGFEADEFLLHSAQPSRAKPRVKAAGGESASRSGPNA